VKLGKHAWHVYPLEAFGYLLGRAEQSQTKIFAALPCSKASLLGSVWRSLEWHSRKSGQGFKPGCAYSVLL